MIVLGIETSCDETAAAVVEDGRHVRSNAIYTQIARHQPYGGVVPEIACRAHVEVLPDIIQTAMKDAGASWSDIDRIAVTRGPGLASSLLVGVSAAKGLALRTGIPLVGVNHLEGHVCSVFLDGGPDPETECPMTMLLVSGGHTAIIRMNAPSEYALLGQTVDDAAGEALDKGAKLLGLGYPGGPEIEKAAVGGNPKAIAFPKGKLKAGGRHRCGDLDPALCFSFSGIKTALLYRLQNHKDEQADLAASYQQAVIDVLLEQVEEALSLHPSKSFACVGGVARNKVLRAGLDDLSARLKIPMYMAAPAYCTDNAAMIAGAAGQPIAAAQDPFFDFEIKPSLPLGL